MNEKLNKKTNVGALSVRNTKKNLPNCAQKGNKGITLVALIITIIVLLILAVVAIRAVQGDGIISHAKNAQTKYEKGEAKEQDILESYLGTVEGNIPGGSVPAIKRNRIIPEGATYTVRATNTILKGENEDMFPKTPATDDTYEEGDYIYTYNKGENAGIEWSVKVKDTSKTEYGEILSEIAGKPVTSLSGKNIYDGTFYRCTNLTMSPIIPTSITNLNSAFMGCKSLTIPPTIPSSVTNMSYTFRDCTSLTTAPEIPSSVTNMRSTFYYCWSLVTYAGSTDPDGDFSNYIIPSSVTNMNYTFDNCKKLTNSPTIPNSVTSLYNTFASCSSLTTAPIIPSSVKNVEYTFSGCSSLVTYAGSTDPDGDFSNYILPSEVTSLAYTFDYCKKLTKAPAIPMGVKNLKDTFYWCESLVAAPTIPNSVTYMGGTFWSCKSLTGTIRIDANPGYLGDCFIYTIKPITLTGSSTMLSSFASTANNGNVTVSK